MKRGFTLIEVVVYLALFSILMGGAIVAVFNLVENAGRQETQTMLQEEGDFIMAKIDWAASGAQSITAPSTFGTLLSVTRVSGLDSTGAPILSPVSINFSSTDGTISIQEGSGAPYVLNNSNVSVVRLGFLHTIASGNGINPESVAASTTLTARTPNGALVSEDFSTVVYLHH